MLTPKISSRRKGVIFKVLVFGSALSLGTVAYLFFSRSRPVVWSIGEGGDPTGVPYFTIFNPFRDRGPERSADQFLDHLRGEQCEQVMASLSHSTEYQKDTCQRESDYPLDSWRLAYRKDDAQQSKLYYKVWRENYDGLQSPVWITAERVGDQWQVKKYERWY
ncbi:MAG TPA: hypothetical protein VGC87_11030 [Pyrinomonadaceae bacterium]|jgi:hypothetical protein